MGGLEQTVDAQADLGLAFAYCSCILTQAVPYIFSAPYYDKSDRTESSIKLYMVMPPPEVRVYWNSDKRRVFFETYVDSEGILRAFAVSILTHWKL